MTNAQTDIIEIVLIVLKHVLEDSKTEETYVFYNSMEEDSVLNTNLIELGMRVEVVKKNLEKEIVKNMGTSIIKNANQVIQIVVVVFVNL